MRAGPVGRLYGGLYESRHDGLYIRKNACASLCAACARFFLKGFFSIPNSSKVQGWGFETGDLVFWTQSDSEVPNGAQGEVVGFTNDSVKFYRVLWFGNIEEDIFIIDSSNDRLNICLSGKE